MLIAGDVITSARDLHPAFDPRRTPDRVALRALQRYQRSLVGKILHHDRRALAQTASVTLPLGSYSAGFDLDGQNPPQARGTRPEYQQIIGGTVWWEGSAESRDELSIIPWAQRLNTRFWPSAYVQDGTIFLVGREADWDGVESVDVLYTPVPTDLTALADELLLPDAAEPAAVAALGAFMARRGHSDDDLPPIDLGRYEDNADQAEIDYLEEITDRSLVERATVKETWP